MGNRTKASQIRWRSSLLAGSIAVAGSISSAYGASIMFSSVRPLSGPPGTVVTITGSNLSGIKTAWVGAAHDATVANVSSSTVKVTVPKDATSGSIGIYNGTNWGFSAQKFTVTATSTSNPSTPPPVTPPPP